MALTTFQEPPGAPPRPRLGYLLRQAAAAHRLRMERALAGIDVTPPQFLILRLLAESLGSSNAELSRMASLTTPTVSVIVANLKRREALVSRRHAVHGRVQHLDLTESGRALLADCEDRVTKVEAEVQADLTPVEVETVVRWLRAAAISGGRPPDERDP